THPSRIWVQLGIGQNRRALAYDWRRMGRGSPEVFKGRRPYVDRLNQTNRLLAGPFASRKQAVRFLADLRKSGVNGPYIWTSPAGEVVDRLVR
ncbi:MAG: SPOR domain-containing protein, partial [Sphingomonadaceae bacterium]|nr:SPOR domain-containing protein [Sphingomonadaceae bacterium]